MEKSQINPVIIKILSDNNIPVDDALLVLLSIHLDLQCTFIPTVLMQKIRVTNIISVQGNSASDLRTVWNVPLFINNEEIKIKESLQENDFISIFMSLFSERNKTRRGVRGEVVVRMSTFMLDYPCDKEEILAATKKYLAQVTDPTYVKKSHKFIYDGQGKWKTSELKNWIEVLRLDDPEKSYLDDKEVGPIFDPTTEMR
jgi:hypothetical protein